MNKIWIGIGVVAIAGLVALGVWFTAPAEQPAVTENSQLSGQDLLPIGNSITNVSATSPSSAETILLAAPGGTITAGNFIKNPDTIEDPSNQGYYYLGYHLSGVATGTAAAMNPPYVIEYISATQYFNIALLEEPIGSARGEMEQYLMARLGITQDQACRLNYMVSVPDRVNSAFSGRNLGFSFCPGATVLPQ